MNYSLDNLSNNNSTLEKFYTLFFREDWCKNEYTLEEVNYYLSKGAEVKFSNTTPLQDHPYSLITLILKIPKEILEKEPYQPKK